MDAKTQRKEETKQYLNQTVKDTLEEIVQTLLKSKPDDPVSCSHIQVDLMVEILET